MSTPIVMSKELYRLLQVWNQSTPGERYSGALYWYRLHNALRQRVDEHRKCCDLPLTKVTAAFASMSPNNTQKANVRALDTLLKFYCAGGKGTDLDQLKVSCYGRDKRRAWELLALTFHLEISLKGQKVRAFYLNLMDPDNDNREVTVDGHMANMVRGDRSRLNAVRSIGKREYLRIGDLVRQAADSVGLRPSHFQAVVWMTWKRIHNIAHDPQEVLFL